jgi:aryl-alcohol dehydrogenase-like predicted oxidoreductase
MVSSSRSANDPFSAEQARIARRRRKGRTTALFVGSASEPTIASATLRSSGSLRIVDEVQALASELDATPAQVALAWLLAQGDDIAPIPGTKHVSRVEENTAADGLELGAEQIQRLNDLTPATGERHDDANMAAIDH